MASSDALKIQKGRLCHLQQMVNLALTSRICEGQNSKSKWVPIPSTNIFLLFFFFLANKYKHSCLHTYTHTYSNIYKNSNIICLFHSFRKDLFQIHYVKVLQAGIKGQTFQYDKTFFFNSSMTECSELWGPYCSF